MRRRTRIAAFAAVVVVAAGAGVAVRSRPATEPGPVPQPGRCGGVVREPVDSRSLQHVFPGAPPPVFTTGQPTSGPHSPVDLAGVQAEPLSPVTQIGVLEEGGILLQHQGLDEGARARLEALAGPKVVVAPGSGLPSAVLATAWTVRLRCDGVEPVSLQRFIDRFEGRGLG